MIVAETSVFREHPRLSCPSLTIRPEEWKTPRLLFVYQLSRPEDTFPALLFKPSDQTGRIEDAWPSLKPGDQSGRLEDTWPSLVYQLSRPEDTCPPLLSLWQSNQKAGRSRAEDTCPAQTWRSVRMAISPEDWKTPGLFFVYQLSQPEDTFPALLSKPNDQTGRMEDASPSLCLSVEPTRRYRCARALSVLVRLRDSGSALLPNGSANTLLAHLAS